jgi:hypothetical protein
MTSAVPNVVIVQQDTPNAVNINQDSPNWVNVQQDTPSQVIIEQDAPNQVIVRTGGMASTTTVRHVHTQASPALEWTINHTLGGKPQVTVVDSADTVVVGDVTYNGTTQVILSFTAAFSGFAYLT